MRRDIASHIHTDLRTARRTKRGATIRSEDVKTRQYKEYPRMPRIILPNATSEITLGDALKRRGSFTGNWQAGPLSLEDADMLLSGLRIRPDGSRPYPSGGSLYPIETYLVGLIGKSEPAVYHYHPQVHALEHLWTASESFFDMSDIFPSDDSPAGAASCAVIFTAIWERSAAKYGDFSYMLSLLEAGHMAQNLLLSAAGINVGARPMAGFNDETVQDLLDIGDEDEQAVYAISLHPKHTL